MPYSWRSRSIRCISFSRRSIISARQRDASSSDKRSALRRLQFKLVACSRSSAEFFGLDVRRVLILAKNGCLASAVPEGFAFCFESGYCRVALGRVFVARMCPHESRGSPVDSSSWSSGKEPLFYLPRRDLARISQPRWIAIFRRATNRITSRMMSIRRSRRRGHAAHARRASSRERRRSSGSSAGRPCE